MIEIIHGSLLDADADAICQQVNCRNAMGAGLAKAIYTKWPVVKREYHKFCRQVGDPNKLLGQIQVVRHRDIPFDVVNIFGQLDYGRDKMCYTRYDAVSSAFDKLRATYGKDTVIAFPYGFGCGLAGGDWELIRVLIDGSFKDYRIVICQNR